MRWCRFQSGRTVAFGIYDHNLVCANSLTGIGTVDEALEALVPERAKGMTGTTTIFDAPITAPDK